MMSSSLLLNFLKLYCNSVYAKASYVVTLSPGIKDELIQRGVQETRISAIPNWSEQERFYPLSFNKALANELGLDKSFLVMFAGTMGFMQGLDSVLEAAQELGETEPDIRFVFIGGGIDKSRLMRLASERKLNNVLFLDRQSPEKIADILGLADVLLVQLRDTPLFRITIPSKLQTYMSIGKPILLAMRGDAADIIRASGAGLVIHPGDPHAIVEGTRKLFYCSASARKKMGENGRAYYLRNLSKEHGVQRFEEIFRFVCCQFVELSGYRQL
jgi:glycosyltransferase involved in cell wall biosynthesis